MFIDIRVNFADFHEFKNYIDTMNFSTHGEQCSINIVYFDFSEISDTYINLYGYSLYFLPGERPTQKFIQF